MRISVCVGVICETPYDEMLSPLCDEHGASQPNRAHAGTPRGHSLRVNRRVALLSLASHLVHRPSIALKSAIILSVHCRHAAEPEEATVLLYVQQPQPWFMLQRTGRMRTVAQRHICF